MILPVKKIILASLVFVLIHWKKIIEISIIPIIFTAPLLLVIQDIILFYEQFLVNQTYDIANLPSNIPLYTLLFLYGYSLLAINLARLIMLGADSVSATDCIFDVIRIAKYIGLSMIIGLFVLLSVVITQLVLINLIVYFLIIPLTLNFVNIAITRPLNLRLTLPFVVQTNLFFMQVLIPLLFIFVFEFIFGLNIYAYIAAEVVVFYWSSINIAFCYQVIVADNSKQSL